MNSKPVDDLEAVRLIIGTLESFNEDDQKRILRWSIEKLGIQISTEVDTQNNDGSNQKFATRTMDIKAFIEEKSPSNDQHFATTVAYYYRFQAPESFKKESVNSQDLQEACRLVGRARLTHPVKTLNNALMSGLLNKGPERGTYVINTVGENLVAMTLPMSSSTNGVKKTGKKKIKAKK